jgi:hypothetical protein
MKPEGSSKLRNIRKSNTLIIWRGMTQETIVIQSGALCALVLSLATPVMGFGHNHWVLYKRQDIFVIPGLMAEEEGKERKV